MNVILLFLLILLGTGKGNLLIYNKTKKQKIPVVGKHSKRICCGHWSLGGNKLVLGAEDKSLTISNENGETLIHTELKHAPLQTWFSYKQVHRNETNTNDNTVSANLGGKSMLLFNIMDEKEDPVELTFAQGKNGSCKYGNLVDHAWYDDGMVMIAFSDGYIVSVSTHDEDLGVEKQAVRFHPSNLINFSYNKALNKIASAGSDGVRVFDSKKFKEFKNDFIPTSGLEDGRISDLKWSPDGQILTIATSSGNVYNFLAQMSVLSTRYKNTVAYLSSLREVSIIDISKRHKPIDLTLRVEPSIIALGAKHVAAGTNNRVYYNRISSSGQGGGVEHEYAGTVQDIHLNAQYTAVLADSKVHLHVIESTRDGRDNDKEKRMVFPSREEGSFSRITCVALTDDFLFYGTEGGTVEMFYLGEWAMLSSVELRLKSPIKNIYPNTNGTRVVVVDIYQQVYLFNPVTGGGFNASIIKFEDNGDNDPEPGGIQTVTNVLWDYKEKNVIVIMDGKYMHSFVYIAESIKGPYLIKLGPIEVGPSGEITYHPEKTEIPNGDIPLILSDGTFTCQSSGGSINTTVHPYFNQMSNLPSSPGNRRRYDNLSNESVSDLKYRFCQSMALLKLEQAWQAAIALDLRQYWLALSHKAMECLNIDLAIRVYRQLRDAGMVMALQKCVHIEDKSLLAGHIYLLFSDYQRAQDLFLASNSPIAALDMRRDLLHWEQALKLAETLDQAQIPDINIQYGQQLEFRDEVDLALKMFESALSIVDSNGKGLCPEKSIPQAMMGVARCNLRLGNIRQGMRLANELDDRNLYEDCGDILESQKQFSEAAAVYIKAQNYERAGHIFIKYLIKADKSRVNEAADIMEKVNSDQLNSQFGKICVTLNRYEEAVHAFTRAKDMDKVVEIKLRNLDQAQQAFDLVRETSSAQGAVIVAEYCQETNDHKGAIEFFLVANKYEEAFRLAQTHSLVDIYTSILGDQITADDSLKIAHYFEKNQDFGKAGKFYSLCGQYSRALKLFFQCGDREIDAAIDVVAKSQNDSLTDQLIDFLVGEKDGIPKDQNYLYKVYMARKKYEDAAKMAMVIARQEQDIGNYKEAHKIVVDTISQLERSEAKVPHQLRQLFVLLHSYTLVKNLVKNDEHEDAARLLLRVAKNVSKFPKSMVKILTSTVIECQRAGLKAASYEYAVVLMRPEYRSSINVDIKRKIEAIVRRRSAVGDDTPEPLSACPISAQEIPSYSLECPTTKDALPMCAVTGKHMILSDWCLCPNSKFPVLYSEYLKYVRRELATAVAESKVAEDSGDSKMNESKSSGAALVVDPVIGKLLDPQSIVQMSPEDALKYVERYNNVRQTEEIKDNGAEGTISAEVDDNGEEKKDNEGKE